jgi:Immunoglobulin I-set domain
MLFTSETLHRVTAPEFVQPLRAVDAPEGTSVMLECHVTGVPPPSVVWRRDNNVITETSPDYILTQSAGTCCLKIKRASKDHAGQYSCLATNPGGEATTSATLNVICKLTHVQIEVVTDYRF